MWRCATAENRKKEKISMLNLRLCVEEYFQCCSDCDFIRNFLIFRLIIFSESLLLCLLCAARMRKKVFLFLLLGSKTFLEYFRQTQSNRLCLPFAIFWSSFSGKISPFCDFRYFSFSLRMEIDVEKLALINNKNTFLLFIYFFGEVFIA
jgi:hypothetical protein